MQKHTMGKKGGTTFTPDQYRQLWAAQKMPESEGIREIPREGTRERITCDDLPDGLLADSKLPSGARFGSHGGQGLRLEEAEGSTGDCGAGVMGDTAVDGSRSLDWQPGSGDGQQESSRGSDIPSPWSELQWLPCRDGKARPTEPGLQPLAHGVPCRVGRLRAYGNAIVPQVAAAFIQAVME